MDANFRRAMREGAADACGFVLGALAGWGVGKLLGFDFIGTAGYGHEAMFGLVFIALGCGAGKWLAQRWLAQTAQEDKP